MGTKSKWEYFRAIYQRYRKASLLVKTQILEEFCHVCGYNRKYAIAKLNGPAPQFKLPAKRRRRSLTYTSQVLSILQAIWEASGYPWSVRLKALLPLWLPWVKKRYSLTPKIEDQLLSISARQIDRRLKGRKTQLKRRLYGRTKPGTCSNTISPSKPIPGMSKPQGLPKSIWSRTQAAPKRVSSSIPSMSPISTPPGSKAVPSWVKVSTG